MIRPAVAADAAAVFALLEEFAVSHRPDRAAFARHYPALVRSEHAALLVAERAGRVIGYALAFDLLTLFANGIVCEVQELVVTEAERGAGVGAALIEALAERARRIGAVEIAVPTRRAGELYPRLGFERTAEYFKRRP